MFAASRAGVLLLTILIAATPVITTLGGQLSKNCGASLKTEFKSIDRIDTNSTNPPFSSTSAEMPPTSGRAIYLSLLKRLYEINMWNPVKLGLENMQALMRVLQNPLRDTGIVHVTGTNGKGSVCIKISNCFVDSGISTGLLTSPHISSFKERIQVNRGLLTDRDVQDFLPHLFQVCEEHDIPATFFELTTALAFVQYQAKACEVAVLEVGLGGRLDATNVVNPPPLLHPIAPAPAPALENPVSPQPPPPPPRGSVDHEVSGSSRSQKELNDQAFSGEESLHRTTKTTSTATSTSMAATSSLPAVNSIEDVPNGVNGGVRLCVITSIQLDHVHILGNTIEAIAREKAGIMKPGVDVLVGPQCPLEVMQVEAAKRGAVLYTIEDVLAPHERRCKHYPTCPPPSPLALPSASGLDSGSGSGESIADDFDVDDLNYDLAHAALKLLVRSDYQRRRNAARNALKQEQECEHECEHQQSVRSLNASPFRGVFAERLRHALSHHPAGDKSELRRDADAACTTAPCENNNSNGASSSNKRGSSSSTGRMKCDEQSEIPALSDIAVDIPFYHRALLTRPPCRFEVIRTIYDPQHNDDAAVLVSVEGEEVTGGAEESHGSLSRSSDTSSEAQGSHVPDGWLQKIRTQETKELQNRDNARIKGVISTQQIHVDVVLDIAHNLDAIISLVRKIKHSQYQKYIPTSAAAAAGRSSAPPLDVAPIRFVVAMSKDKDVKQSLLQLLRLVHFDLSLFHCTEADHPRAMPSAELRQTLVALANKHADADVDMHRRRHKAQEQALGEDAPPSEHADAGPKNVYIETSSRCNINGSGSDGTGGEGNQGKIGDEGDGLRHDAADNDSEDVRTAVKRALAKVASCCNSSNQSRISQASGPKSGFESGSKSKSGTEQGVVVVCGTAFVMAEARAAIGIREPRDSERDEHREQQQQQQQLEEQEEEQIAAATAAQEDADQKISQHTLQCFPSKRHRGTADAKTAEDVNEGGRGGEGNGTIVGERRGLANEQDPMGNARPTKKKTFRDAQEFFSSGSSS